MSGRVEDRKARTLDPERIRLQEASSETRPWYRWGPYLSERQWGTVREDYSPNGDAWNYFPFDTARSRAYRWGEDGIAGLSDRGQRLCLSLALWNEQDPILKERLFGLTNGEGNHGEDVKELYYYLDATPTHSYLKMLYKYPQAPFPYRELVGENRGRGRRQPEFEILETGLFRDQRYFDVFVEYAKATPTDILMRIRAINRGPEPAPLHLLPTLWFRNTWSWQENAVRPRLSRDAGALLVEHQEMGNYRAYFDEEPEIRFCDNETNGPRLFGTAEGEGFYKDGLCDFVVSGVDGAVNDEPFGTKAAAHYRGSIGPGEERVIRCRLVRGRPSAPFNEFDALIDLRREEADRFYDVLQSGIRSEDEKRVQRQALAGMIWNKQFYNFDVRRWLRGDRSQPEPPKSRRNGRNSGWLHLKNSEIVSMPDKWEYPWFAAWDTAFHCIPFALIDPHFAKKQLTFLTREWSMHPNGQLPAYEWSFDDVNPPVHAWAAWRVYKIEQRRFGKGDLDFLERVFHKLMLNFTWWVNRKDVDGRNIFQGGFLGLDNIGVFDRSAELPSGGHIEQADGTSWMAMYCLNLMRIALELSRSNNVYEDVATKFFEHFLHIAEAMADFDGDGHGLWDEEDQFYYDRLHLPDGESVTMRLRSMVGLIPLFAVETIEPETLRALPAFAERLEWFLAHRPDLAALVSRWYEPGRGERRLLSLLRGSRMKRLLRRMLDESEFLSPYGVRAMSKVYEKRPYTATIGGNDYEVRYTPGASDSPLFGGNSNWRGPVWFPVNYLIIESLQKFHHYYGSDFKIECPTGSGRYLTIAGVADEIARRLNRIFLRDSSGKRAVYGEDALLQRDPNFRDHILFYEYFHGDDGRGIGASHQTGWTGLVAKLLQPPEKS